MLLLLLLLLLLVPPLLLPAAPPQTPPGGRVDANRYDAVWLWAGVRPQTALDRASRIYVLQGAVFDGAEARLVAQRPAIPPCGTRTNMADSTGGDPGLVAADLRPAASRPRTLASGEQPGGKCPDRFDARRRHLTSYAAFLTTLRDALPARYKLATTGLDRLAGVVDDVVLHIYQGRHVRARCGVYFAKLGRLKIPFCIGLVQGGKSSHRVD